MPGGGGPRRADKALEPAGIGQGRLQSQDEKQDRHDKSHAREKSKIQAIKKMSDIKPREVNLEPSSQLSNGWRLPG